MRVYAGKDYNTSVGFTATVSEIMVSANADDSYEPYTPPITTPIYLDSPLYKIGDYADSRGMTEEVRTVKELVLTGNEYWRKDTSAENLFYYVDNIIPTNDMLCTHLPTLTTYPKGKIGIFKAPTGVLYINIGTTVNTVDDFKSYLAQQYSAGTPVKVYYVLAEPETNAINPVEIPTVKGSNVIDINTAVKPSNMYVKYPTDKRTGEYDEQLTNEYLEIMGDV